MEVNEAFKRKRDTPHIYNSYSSTPSSHNSSDNFVTSKIHIGDNYTMADHEQLTHDHPAMMTTLSDPRMVDYLRKILLADYKAEVDYELESKDREISKLRKIVSVLETKIDDVDQETRFHSIRIAGLPELSAEALDNCPDKKEDTKQRVCELFKTRMKINDFEEEYLSKAVRLPLRVGTTGPRAILAKVSCDRAKQLVMKARVNLKVRENDSTTPIISINDDLTPLKSKTAYEARKLKKVNDIKDTWVDNGRVLIKDNKDKNHRVRNVEDVQKFESVHTQAQREEMEIVEQEGPPPPRNHHTQATSTPAFRPSRLPSPNRNRHERQPNAGRSARPFDYGAYRSSYDDRGSNTVRRS